MNGEADYNPQTVEDVYKDFKNRRAGIIKALTTDSKEFYALCDPRKDNLCLYGLPNKQWKVDVPLQELPGMPEPTVGINFARDGTRETLWLKLIAVHSDSWLLAVSFYLGSKLGFDKDKRMQLFDMINNLPKVIEILKENESVSTQSGSKHLSNIDKGDTKVGTSTKPKGRKMDTETDNNDGADGKGLMGKKVDIERYTDGDDGVMLCGACGKIESYNEFWIGCDTCKKWYHGVCVKITAVKAGEIKQYKCPSCSN